MRRLLNVAAAADTLVILILECECVGGAFGVSLVGDSALELVSIINLCPRSIAACKRAVSGKMSCLA